MSISRCDLWKVVIRQRKPDSRTAGRTTIHPESCSAVIDVVDMANPELVIHEFLHLWYFMTFEKKRMIEREEENMVMKLAKYTTAVAFAGGMGVLPAEDAKSTMVSRDCPDDALTRNAAAGAIDLINDGNIDAVRVAAQNQMTAQAAVESASLATMLAFMSGFMNGFRFRENKFSPETMAFVKDQILPGYEALLSRIARGTNLPAASLAQLESLKKWFDFFKPIFVNVWEHGHRF